MHFFCGVQADNSKPLALGTLKTDLPPIGPLRFEKKCILHWSITLKIADFGKHTNLIGVEIFACMNISFALG